MYILYIDTYNTHIHTHTHTHTHTQELHCQLVFLHLACTSDSNGTRKPFCQEAYVLSRKRVRRRGVGAGGGFGPRCQC